MPLDGSRYSENEDALTAQAQAEERVILRRMQAIIAAATGKPVAGNAPDPTARGNGFRQWDIWHSNEPVEGRQDELSAFNDEIEQRLVAISGVAKSYQISDAPISFKNLREKLEGWREPDQSPEGARIAQIQSTLRRNIENGERISSNRLAQQTEQQTLTELLNKFAEFEKVRKGECSESLVETYQNGLRTWKDFVENRLQSISANPQNYDIEAGRKILEQIIEGFEGNARAAEALQLEQVENRDQAQDAKNKLACATAHRALNAIDCINPINNGVIKIAKGGYDKLSAIAAALAPQAAEVDATQSLIPAAGAGGGSGGGVVDPAAKKDGDADDDNRVGPVDPEERTSSSRRPQAAIGNYLKNTGAYLWDNKIEIGLGMAAGVGVRVAFAAAAAAITTPVIGWAVVGLAASAFSRVVRETVHSRRTTGKWLSLRQMGRAALKGAGWGLVGEALGFGLTSLFVPVDSVHHVVSGAGTPTPTPSPAVPVIGAEPPPAPPVAPPAPVTPDYIGQAKDALNNLPPGTHLSHHLQALVDKAEAPGASAFDVENACKQVSFAEINSNWHTAATRVFGGKLVDLGAHIARTAADHGTVAKELCRDRAYELLYGLHGIQQNVPQAAEFAKAAGSLGRSFLDAATRFLAPTPA